MKSMRYLTLSFLLVAPALAQNLAAGLWTGEVLLKQVSEVHFRQTTGNTPTDVAAPFSMRVLLHVDGAGTVRILKEAVLMQTTATTPVPVIVTQPNLIPNFQGIVERGGKMVGRRFSSASFPMTGDSLTLTGSLAAGGSATGTLTLAATNPVNPFRHKYHPDLANAGVAVTRAISISIAPGDTPADQQLVGTWSETMTGLHKDAINIAGTLTLSRVSTVSNLNQP